MFQGSHFEEVSFEQRSAGVEGESGDVPMPAEKTAEEQTPRGRGLCHRVEESLETRWLMWWSGMTRKSEKS